MTHNIKTLKRCLVTGASRGIGRATALALAERGAEVFIHYHKEKAAADSLLKIMPGAGHSIVSADLSRPEQIQQLYEALAAKGVNVLVNNAGVYLEKPMLDMDFNEWQSVWDLTINLNLRGPAHLSYLFARQMAQNRGGRIINISSRGAFRGEPDALAYGASKAGLNSFGQSMAKALAHKKVLVFTVAPGFVETDMAIGALKGPHGDAIKAQSPLNRVALPEEVAGISVYLAFDAPEYMTGAIVDLNGASYLRM